MVLIRSCLVVVAVCELISYGEAELEQHCGQLGCDQAGLFTQDGYKLPIDGGRKLAWTSAHPSMVKMSPQNENYGCVGSSKVIVCPYHKDTQGNTRHIMLHTDTGVEYDATGYETLDNVNMPVLTKDNLVFAVNSSHASLVDPLNNRSSITTLPTKNAYGIHSPIYLPNLGFYVVFGNLSLNHSIYKIGKDLATGRSVLNLVTTFTIRKSSTIACPWLIITEGTAHENRVYFFAVHKDESSGVAAVEFLPDAPYYRKLWVLDDDEPGFSSPLSSHLGNKESADSCTYIPSVDPEYSTFSPADVSNQLLATPDGYVIITSPIGLIAVKDHGDSGEQTSLSLFGAHFISSDNSPISKGKSPIVWMTGWSQYPPFRILLSAYNYTSNDVDTTHWYIDLNEKLGVPDLNVTSRITTFSDPSDEHKKILVFGVSVNSTDRASHFHTKYCPECEVGITNILMAVRTAPNNTKTPDIVWMSIVPLSPRTMEIRGQVIGVSDKIVMYITDGKTGNVAAFE